MCIGNEIPDKLKNEKKYPGDPVYVGGIYTIREIDLRCVPLWGFSALRFEGIVGSTEVNCLGLWDTMSFLSIWFRPLIEKKFSTETGMAILRKIADEASKEKVDATEIR